MYEFESLWEKDMAQSIIDGNLEIMEDEMKKGWNINEPLQSYALNGVLMYPLLLAIQYNNFDSIKFLISHKSKLDFNFKNPPYAIRKHAIFYAIEYSNFEIIRYIASKGAKLYDSVSGISAYDIAYSNNNKCIDLLNDIGLPIIPYAIHAFLSSITDYNYSIIDKFISKYDILNLSIKTQHNKFGNTALCHAAMYCDPKMINYLISKGADPLKTNLNGECPYMLALKMKKMENAELLKGYETINHSIFETLPSGYKELNDKGQIIIHTKKYGTIKFLNIEEIYPYYLPEQKNIVLSDHFECYPDIRIMWNIEKQCVSYYDIEMTVYGEFNVSLIEFIYNIDLYLEGIFTDKYFVSRIDDVTPSYNVKP